MIFVTVGTAVGGGEFDRLVKKIDAMAPSLGEDVLIQIGAGKYIPENAKWLRYIDHGQVLDYFRGAKLVIAHCGTGTVISALSSGSRLIVVPRRAHLAEHSDDHQMEIARFLEKEDLAEVVYEVEDLDAAVKAALAGSPGPGKAASSGQRQSLVRGVRGYLDTLREKV